MKTKAKANEKDVKVNECTILIDIFILSLLNWREFYRKYVATTNSNIQNDWQHAICSTTTKKKKQTTITLKIYVNLYWSPVQCTTQNNYLSHLKNDSERALQPQQKLHAKWLPLMCYSFLCMAAATTRATTTKKKWIYQSHFINTWKLPMATTIFIIGHCDVFCFVALFNHVHFFFSCYWNLVSILVFRKICVFFLSLNCCDANIQNETNWAQSLFHFIERSRFLMTNNRENGQMINVIFMKYR